MPVDKRIMELQKIDKVCIRIFGHTPRNCAKYHIEQAFDNYYAGRMKGYNRMLNEGWAQYHAAKSLKHLV